MFERAIFATALTLFAQAPLMPQAQAQGLPTFFALLNGNSECDNTAPPAGPICRQGDADGFGSATVTIITGTQICVGIVVDNLVGTTLVHIHQGAATVNGPVVVSISPNLPPPTAPGNGNPGATSGCIGAIAPATVAAIRANPQLYYINVHNAAFPGGAIRGQLF